MVAVSSDSTLNQRWKDNSDWADTPVHYRRDTDRPTQSDGCQQIARDLGARVIDVEERGDLLSEMLLAARGDANYQIHLTYPIDEIDAAFRRVYADRYGDAPDGGSEIVNYRLTAWGVCSGVRCPAVVLDDVVPREAPYVLQLEDTPHVRGVVEREDGTPVWGAQVHHLAWPGGEFATYRFGTVVGDLPRA